MWVQVAATKKTCQWVVSPGEFRREHQSGGRTSNPESPGLATSSGKHRPASVWLCVGDGRGGKGDRFRRCPTCLQKPSQRYTPSRKFRVFPSMTEMSVSGASSVLAKSRPNSGTRKCCHPIPYLLLFLGVPHDLHPRYHTHLASA